MFIDFNEGNILISFPSLKSMVEFLLRENLKKTSQINDSTKIPNRAFYRNSNGNFIEDYIHWDRDPLIVFYRDFKDNQTVKPGGLYGFHKGSYILNNQYHYFCSIV